MITVSGPDVTFSVPQSSYKVAVDLHLMGVHTCRLGSVWDTSPFVP